MLLPGPADGTRRGAIVNIFRSTVSGPDQRIYEGSRYEGRAINTLAVYSNLRRFGGSRVTWRLTGVQAACVNAITPGGVFSGQNDMSYLGTAPRTDGLSQPGQMSGAQVFSSRSIVARPRMFRRRRPVGLAAMRCLHSPRRASTVAGSEAPRCDGGYAECGADAVGAQTLAAELASPRARRPSNSALALHQLSPPGRAAGGELSAPEG
jgi:hypothetical protein